MRLEADRFANNQWPDEEFRREIEVVKEERRMRTEDSPHAMLHEQASAMTFLASPYRRPIVGWMSDLDAMTPADVRDFYRRWYVPGNAAVVVAGDVQALTVLAAVRDGYSGARLERALVQGEGRLADSAGASNGLMGRGPQLFSLDGVPAEGKTTAQVAEALRQQVAIIAREGVSDA